MKNPNAFKKWLLLATLFYISACSGSVDYQGDGFSARFSSEPSVKPENFDKKTGEYSEIHYDLNQMRHDVNQIRYTRESISVFRVSGDSCAAASEDKVNKSMVDGKVEYEEDYLFKYHDGDKSYLSKKLSGAINMDYIKLGSELYFQEVVIAVDCKIYKISVSGDEKDKVKIRFGELYKSFRLVEKKN